MSASPHKDDEDVEPEAAKTPPQDQEEPQQEEGQGPMQGHPATQEQEQGLLYETEVKEQDRWLPIANVARIMKMALPENAKIAKEAKECMQECVSEFISFITSEASEKCQQEKRKTVNGEDVLFAMGSLGFENYGEALKIYLAKYRESNISRSNEQGQAGGQGRPSSGYGSAPPMTGLRSDDEGPGGQSNPSVGGPSPGEPGEPTTAPPPPPDVVSPTGAAVAGGAFPGTQEPNGAAHPPFPYSPAVMPNGTAAHY